MGMSASQCRLLAITSRIHDVELEAQGIEAQKIALATQQDKVYQEYQDALSATALKVKFTDGNSSSLVPATYDSVCNYSECRPKNYVLVDNRTGKIMVDKDMADTYKQYKHDKYAFAYAMMGVTPDEGIMKGLEGTENTENTPVVDNNSAPQETGHWETIEVTVPGETHTYTYYVGTVSGEGYVENQMGEEDPGSRHRDGIDITTEDKKESKEDCYEAWFYSMVERYGRDWMPDDSTIIYNLHTEQVTEKDPDTTTTQEIWVVDTPETPSGNADEPSTTETKSLADVFTELAEACNKGNLEFSSSQFQFYCQKWEAIDEAGGCIALESQYENGDEGAKCFKNEIESGDIIIRGYDENGSKNCWSDTSFATSTNSNYLQEVNDTTQEKIAEAKYEQALNEINKKDTQYDTELNKLETERTSLTTEKDGIEKIIQENSERTFNLFS